MLQAIVRADSNTHINFHSYIMYWSIENRELEIGNLIYMKAKHLAFYVIMVLCIFLSNLVSSDGARPDVGASLMPLPKHLERSFGKFSIDRTFAVHLAGCRDPRLSPAVSRLLQRLQKKTGIQFMGSPSAAPAKFEINCSAAEERVQSLTADESYTLEVGSHGARLDAPFALGILRGLETFLQLVDRDDGSFFIPAVKIEDSPRFRWRGLLIDVSRHWITPDIIRRNLDAMAAMKMNVFHWHLSDDQGFRVECKTYPKLHQKGSDGNYYTQKEVREIVAYAGERGIRVVPEFDMPGHTTALLAAYPEFAGARGPISIERTWGVSDACMDPTSNKLYSFLDAFIGEMAGLFPDEYFHIGGDEVNGKLWNANAKIQSFKKRKHFKNNGDLQAYFNQRLVKILAKHGKHMIGWDEILHPALPTNIVIQSWRGQASLADGARRKYSGILSHGYYLDHMQPASFHYANDPLIKESAKLSEEEKKRILGGEACMWGEFITVENIESRIWPRTAAIAERLWSPQETQDIPDMYRRLEGASRELELLGLTHRSKPAEMLQRMAGDQNVAPLKMLADLLTPGSLGTRQHTKKYQSTTPLNRMVDAVLPESDAARQFGNLVDSALANTASAGEAFQNIRYLLSLWHENRVQVKPIFERSPLLKEIDPVSETIAQLSAGGLQALDYLASGQKPPDAWIKEYTLLIERSEKPQAEMLIAIVPPIKKLIAATKAAKAK
jgi:hexosaminidase